MAKLSLAVCLAVTVVLLLCLYAEEAAADGYGGKGAHGTACIVKGSYCSCHYCKCEKGDIHCGYSKGGYGKKYCYGSMEGQYCHCDYCKCKHGYGSTGYGCHRK